MRIAVIDGQGGGIGKTIVERLRASFGSSVTIIALGTNSLATSAMLKAGADQGASGENAVVFNVSKVDFIVGSIGIISANSMLGELSPEMAKAVSESNAIKVLIPLNRCNLNIVGIKDQSLLQFIDELIETVRKFMV
jgi:NAD(P)-dependent dehydrogenase (short-subunit alcohol dehydrogenase family)